MCVIYCSLIIEAEIFDRPFCGLLHLFSSFIRVALWFFSHNVPSSCTGFSLFQFCVSPSSSFVVSQISLYLISLWLYVVLHQISVTALYLDSLWLYVVLHQSGFPLGLHTSLSGLKVVLRLVCLCYST